MFCRWNNLPCQPLLEPIKFLFVYLFPPLQPVNAKQNKQTNKQNVSESHSADNAIQRIKKLSEDISVMKNDVKDHVKVKSKRPRQTDRNCALPATPGAARACIACEGGDRKGNGERESDARTTREGNRRGRRESKLSFLFPSLPSRVAHASDYPSPFPFLSPPSQARTVS